MVNNWYSYHDSTDLCRGACEHFLSTSIACDPLPYGGEICMIKSDKHTNIHWMYRAQVSCSVLEINQSHQADDAYDDLKTNDNVLKWKNIVY